MGKKIKVEIWAAGVGHVEEIRDEADREFYYNLPFESENVYATRVTDVDDQ